MEIKKKYIFDEFTEFTTKNIFFLRKIILNKILIFVFLFPELKEIVERFFDKTGVEIYSGYVDDPRNTDNAWIETTAYSFHDESGKELEAIAFQAGDDAGEVKWIEISDNIKLHANHKDIIKMVANKFRAHWYWMASVS